jgi:hypothetical protein
LHQAEQKTKSLSDSLVTIDKEVERIRREAVRVQTAPTISHQRQKKSIAPILASVFLQMGGIGLLYIETLVIKRLSVPYIALSIVMMVAGFFIGNKPAVSTEKISSREALPESENVRKILDHLNLDRRMMLEQKEQLRAKIESGKIDIIALQEALQRPYLASISSDQNS